MDSIPLITASILSKKLAAGLDALVIDVKVGSGGLAGPIDAATALAQSDTRALGVLLIELGGGRRRADDAIDPAVGLAEMCGVGDAVGPDRPLAVIHARSAADADAAAAVVRQALAVVDGPAPAPRSPLLGRIVSPA